jgi:myo-inositol-1(or 4)-monophosphatase
MTEINKDAIIEQLALVGADLKQQFATLDPVIEPNDMMAVFHRIDGAASNAIKAALQKLHPGITWLEGELDGVDTWARINDGRYWICDAIDGGVQFLRAIPQWCISLTLIDNGQAVFAVILDVMHNELFYAIAGEGAYLNHRRMHVNTKTSHVAGVLSASQPPFINKNKKVIRQLGDSLAAVLPDAGAVRNLGPTSLQLAYVACGRLDAFWEYGEDVFNCLGGALVIKEAGGKVTDVQGNAYTLRAESIIAAPPLVHASLMRVLREI